MHTLEKSFRSSIESGFLGVATANLYPEMYPEKNHITANLDISSDWLVDSIPHGESNPKKAVKMAINLDKILDEIEQARQFAIEQQKPTAMLQASMAKAKLLGLDKGDTLTIKHNEPPVFNIQPVRTLTELDKQEFEQIAKKVLAMV